MTDTLIVANQKRWNTCKIVPSKLALFDSVAKRLTAPEAKAKYIIVQNKTGVPWWFIAVVHEREASQRWDRSLAQGDPWNKKSIHVPKGRGPFQSWEEAAVDALVNCAPFAARNKDWSPGAALTLLEGYNGLGYFKRGLPSPYVWAGTNQYVKGKYVADRQFDPDVVDKQLGVAGLLQRMNVFSTKNTTAEAGTAGAVILGGATAASQYMQYAPYIFAGTIVAALIGWLIVRWYKSRKEVVSQ